MTRPGWTRGSRGHEALAEAIARQQARDLWAVTPEMQERWREAAADFVLGTSTDPATSERYRRLMSRVNDQTRRLAVRHSYFVGNGGGSEPPTTIAAGEGDGHVHVRLEADVSRYVEAIDESRDAVSRDAFEAELRTVTTSVDDRIDIRKAAIELAKLGVTSDSVARLIANGHRWETRRAYDAQEIVSRIRSVVDQTMSDLGSRIVREIEGEQ